tara:strand:- start:1797 stop:2393 length:597 start_codon:yes stop_codon:yes gene_type:complete
MFYSQRWQLAKTNGSICLLRIIQLNLPFVAIVVSEGGCLDSKRKCVTTQISRLRAVTVGLCKMKGNAMRQNMCVSGLLTKLTQNKKMTPLVIVTLLLASGANTCVKWFGGSTVSRIVSIVLNSASFVTMSYILQNEQMGEVQVAVSSGMITLSVIVGRVLFDETITLYKSLAIAFSFTAIFLNAFSPKKEATLITEQE